MDCVGFFLSLIPGALRAFYCLQTLPGPGVCLGNNYILDYWPVHLWPGQVFVEFGNKVVVRIYSRRK